ncbi:type IV pilin protein [Phascolarctobacterium faecium]|uniref:type IV pilin protein n=1 Tax=Phascolarctobacterium faecium TaxID=33025 RepID=UPI003AB354B7
MKKFNYGFTLVELVIVIAVLGILAGIAIPHFMEASTSARFWQTYARLTVPVISMQSITVVQQKMWKLWSKQVCWQLNR